MARATRSQRQPNASQRATQQATQRRSAEEEEEEVDLNEGNGSDDAMDEDITGGGGTEDITRRACALVRLALFSERRRVSLKRDEISKKVMGPRSRSFPEVFKEAQEMLRKSFGMELVELQTRQEPEPEPTQKPKDGALPKKRGATSGTKQYMLRSVLDPEIIELCSAPDQDLKELEAQESLHNEEDEEEGSTQTPCGALFAWERSDQLANLGVLHIILALILVSGRTINDNELRALLKRLRLHSGTQLAYNEHTTHAELTLETFLSQAIRQGYLDRTRIGETKGPGAKKRGRAPATQNPDGQDDGHLWEWRWGHRAFSEIGEVGIAKLAAELMVQRGSRRIEDDPESGGKKRLLAVYQGIEKAAGGGQLHDNRASS